MPLCQRDRDFVRDFICSAISSHHITSGQRRIYSDQDIEQWINFGVRRSYNTLAANNVPYGVDAPEVIRNTMLFRLTLDGATPSLTQHNIKVINPYAKER